MTGSCPRKTSQGSTPQLVPEPQRVLTEGSSSRSQSWAAGSFVAKEGSYLQQSHTAPFRWLVELLTEIINKTSA